MVHFTWDLVYNRNNNIVINCLGFLAFRIMMEHLLVSFFSLFRDSSSFYGIAMSICPDRALTILNSRHTETTNTVRNISLATHFFYCPKKVLINCWPVYVILVSADCLNIEVTL
jgi:hypothetical protein